MRMDAIALSTWHARPKRWVKCCGLRGDCDGRSTQWKLLRQAAFATALAGRRLVTLRNPAMRCEGAGSGAHPHALVFGTRRPAAAPAAAQDADLALLNIGRKSPAGRGSVSHVAQILEEAALEPAALPMKERAHFALRLRAGHAPHAADFPSHAGNGPVLHRQAVRQRMPA